MIARAVMEQFAEERENEINAIRADIYAELKVELHDSVDYIYCAVSWI